MTSIFAGINGTVNVLEDSLCDWTQFPFEKYEGNMELLEDQEWRKGQAIELYISKANFMRHEIQGGRKYYKKYKAQSLKALTFHPQYQRYADINLQNIAKKVILVFQKIFLTREAFFSVETLILIKDKDIYVA